MSEAWVCDQLHHHPGDRPASGQCPDVQCTCPANLYGFGHAPSCGKTGEPDPRDMIRELRAVLRLPNTADPSTPQQVWRATLDAVRRWMIRAEGAEAGEAEEINKRLIRPGEGDAASNAGHAAGVAAVASGIVEAWWRDNAYIEMTQRSIDRLEAAIAAALQRERGAPGVLSHPASTERAVERSDSTLGGEYGLDQQAPDADGQRDRRDEGQETQGAATGHRGDAPHRSDDVRVGLGADVVRSRGAVMGRQAGEVSPLREVDQAPALAASATAPAPVAGGDDVAAVAREALKLFASGNQWGVVKAWLVNGPPSREQGLDVAAQLTRWQCKADEALAALQRERGR